MAKTTLEWENVSLIWMIALFLQIYSCAVMTFIYDRLYKDHLLWFVTPLNKTVKGTHFPNGPDHMVEVKLCHRAKDVSLHSDSWPR